MTADSNHEARLAFLARVWETKPEVMRDAYAAPFLTEEELYTAIKNLWNRRAHEDLIPYLDGRVAFAGEAARVLEPSASTFEEYCHDVSDRLGGATFGVSITRLERYSEEFRSRVEGISDFLLERHGVPAGYFKGSSFFGNYAKTPFEIHTDPAGILTWTVKGTKRMLVWPGAYFKDNPKMLNMGSHQQILDRLENYEADAIVLEAGPRDLMYWPAEYWHAGQGGSEYHATVTLSYYFWAGITSLIGKTIQAELQARLGERSTYWGSLEAGADLPSPIQAGLDAFKELYEQGLLEQAVVGKWQARLQNKGFEPV